MIGPQSVGALEDLEGTVDLPGLLGGHRFGQDQQQLVAAFPDLGLLFARERRGKIAERPVTLVPPAVRRRRGPPRLPCG